MSEKITLQLEIQAMPSNDILSMIDNKTLSEIKSKNPHPLFKAYSLCHDGISKPKVLGEGVTPINWTRSAIQSIKNIMTKGVKFFHLHNSDNSTKDREALGEVVASKEMEIDGKLHHVVVGYFPEPEKVKDKDIISQESLWDFVKQGTQIVADKICELTGIAMSSSDVDKPAFSGAVQLAEVQCFDSEFIQAAGEATGKNILTGEVKVDGESTKGKPMNLTDVINYIKENKVNVGQLGFTLEDVKKDRELGKVFDDMESIKKEKDSLVLKEVDYKKAINDFSRKEQMQTAKQRANAIITNMKLTDKPKTFIEKSLEKEIEKMTDITDASLEKFANEKWELYREIVQSDVSVPTAAMPSGDTSKDKANIAPDDMSKKANNELLNYDL